MNPLFITLAVSSLWIQVQSEVVTQYPEIRWSPVSESAEMNCSHTKGAGYSRMYWYRQRPGETMTRVAYTAVGAKPDYGEAPEGKYSSVKEKSESGALTVNDLQPDDGGVYFCAVSEHSDVTMFCVHSNDMPALVLFSWLLGVCLGVEVTQTPPILLARPGDTVQLVCSHEEEDFTLMQWYQKTPGDNALKRIGHVRFRDIDHEESFKKHFNISGDLSGQKAKNISLFISNLKAPDHTAVYYCAAGYAH
ncbi:hypothetical protein PFLUV_G00229650 [Xyrichtys novacula]|uniref:Ig-like domain-containing protein n=1 Tax=Xyrichtys novacula TaxID=13765 RepID=A0AAV1GMQ4_XYRNO|nr:hypothetical protein PFLUV_G00229650 [Xyrichtys novacula]